MEFVLVSLIFIPLVMGIIQFGLFLHVRNTMAACVHEGARAAAALQPGDRLANGEVRARECISGALDGRFAGDIEASAQGELVSLEARASMPAVGYFGPDIGLVAIDVDGHAVLEPDE